MPFLLHRTKYNKWVNTELTWLKEGEIPADPIFGFRIDFNSMSAWLVDNDDDRIKRTTAALSAKGQTLQDFEYVLLDSKKVENIGIKTIPEEGTSIDHELNKFHHNLIEISAQKLLKLTEVTLPMIKQDNTKIERVPRKKVAQYIVESIKRGRIKQKDIDPKVLEKVQNVLGHTIS